VNTPVIELKEQRERSVQKKHPWIFSGAVGKIQGNPTDGETVAVVSASGNFLAWGAFSKISQISVRVWSWDENEVINKAFFIQRFSNAMQIRKKARLIDATNGMRLVHAESDGIPGLVVDQYGQTLVAQFLSSGVEFWKPTILEALLEVCPSRSVYERSDVDVRTLEGLPLRSGLLAGDEPDERIYISDGELRFGVDIRRGQKTGFYFDQRMNRKQVQKYSNGCDVLDCFSYTGGFSIHSLVGNAKSVVSVDSSSFHLAMQSDNLALNQIAGNVELIEGDVFQVLRSFRDQRKTFDLIILDPPKFAQTTSQVDRAARAYKDINLLAFKLIRPGGILFTFSCSGGVTEELFQKIVASAALDAKVHGRILEHLHQDVDHPVALNFPEGFYLKGLVVQVN
jgi:23S rRNA (cytosine1962-C5)-methyltransferase